MNKYFYIITLLMVSVFLNGCSTERGGSGIVSSGVVSDDVFIADSIKKDETDEVFATVTPYGSLTAASADIENTDDKIFTLQGLAVQGGEVTNYTAGGDFGWSQDGETSITVATITAPAVSLTFDGNGKMSAVKAYFADKTYEVSANGNDSAMQISATNITSGAQTDATIATLTVDRDEVFGFDSNYMAYIGWNLERTQGDANRLDSLGSGKDRAYSINGNMIVGIETDDVSIPRNGEVSFIGKGRGYYSHVDKGISSHATIFDVTTDVDFSTQTINVNSANTMQCGNSIDVSSCKTAVGALEFSTQETFVYITNNKIGFRGDVSLKSDSSFTGTIDARFYGSRAQELGSIFAMRDETGGYYYGAFGGEREGVEAPSVFNTAIGDEALIVAEEIKIDNKITNNLPVNSLTAVADAGDGNAFTMRALTVYKDDTTDYIRAPNRDWARADTARMVGLTQLSGAAASLTFDAAGKISGVTAYLNSKTYTVNVIDDTLTPTATMFSASINGADKDARTTNITVDRGDKFFGFDSNYMAHISWNLEKTDDKLTTDMLDVYDDIYHISGAMLAGIETDDADIHLFGNQVSFNGKGRGTYGDLDGSYDTIFDITAIVNFSARNLLLASSNTCKATDCENEAMRDLDFSISSAPIFYNSNNISANINDADFGSVALDARFYGGDAWEFGGTFAITYATNNSYYYGAFGALRKGITAPSIFDATIDSETVKLPDNVTAPFIPIDIATNNPYESLTAIAGTDKRVVLNALSVYKDDTTIYTRAPKRDWATDADKVTTTSILRLTDSVASLVFTGDNKGETLYVNDVYTNDNATITVDRSKVFVFGSSYMAYISWGIDNEFDNDNTGLTGEVVDISGKMLAGIETNDMNIALTGEVSFNGKGRGTYGNADEEIYDTVFDVRAGVDFVAKNVTIWSENTCKAGDDAKCDVGGADRRDFLDFTSAILSYADGESNAVNHISGAVHADGLAGTIDARFYGGATEEFGGTFALTNLSNYYYGVFGALRGGIAASTIFDNNIVDETVTLPADVTISTTHNSLTAVAKASGTNSLTMKSLAFYQKDTTDYTRAEGREWSTADEQKTSSMVRLLDSAASLSFDGGDVSAVTVYLSGTNHTADASKVKRAADFFGFDSNYMAYISWDIDNHFDDDSEGLEASVVDSNGVMLAGIETASLLDITAGTVDFIGKGQGSYGDADTSYDTIFNVIASVDFAANNVTIRSENTCKAVENADCGESGTDRVNGLNVNTVAIGYAANSISIRNLNVKDMDGALDARFYGDATREFGGTFAFASNISYYYGAFGAERDGVAAPIILNVANNVSVTLPNDVNISTTYNSLADVADSISLADIYYGIVTKSITMNALSAYHDDTTLYTRASTDKVWTTKADKAQTIDIKSFRGAAASLIFDSDGNISGVTAYLNGRTYISDVIDGTLTATSFEASITGADSDASTATITVDRSALFGFASNDMVYISWNLEKTESALDNTIEDSISSNTGAMIAGIKTYELNSVKFLKDITFSGKGRGTYGTVENNELKGYNTVFDVIVDVNLANARKATIRSEKTCEAVDNPDCADGGANRKDFLNFSTGEIAYTGNSISGDVALGSSNLFKGTLDARFYGYVRHEIGGTFSLANSNSYYYGAFGSKRDAVYQFDLNASQVELPVGVVAKQNVAIPDASIYHAISDKSGTEDRLFTMKALSVGVFAYTNYARSPNYEAWEISDRDKYVQLARFENSFASLTIDGSGNLSNIEAYTKAGFANLSYTGSSSSLNQTTLSSDINNFRGSFAWYETDSTTINVSRDTSLFGFEATDMVYISWNIVEKLGNYEKRDRQQKRHGMMIAGIESELAQIPTIESVTFSGKGRGYYANLKTETGFHTIFNVTAQVNFANKSLFISSDAPQRCTDVEDASTCTGSGLNGFNAINIQFLANNISGDIAMASSGTIPRLSGKFDARFYGDAAHKLGGTFALSDNDGDSDNTRYYYGAFGAQRLDAITQFKFDETLAEESGPKSTLAYLTDNQTEYDSLHAVAVTDGSNSFTTNGSAVYQSNHIDYARIANKQWGDASTDTDHNINLGRLSDVGASINFDANGNISGFATYLSINPYIATNIYTITVDNPVSNTDVVSQNITATDTPDDAITGVMNLYRGQSFFGFNSYYMAYIDWQVTRDFTDLGTGTTDKSYDYSGAMLTGIETEDVRIFNLTEGIFDFKGKGRGVYHNTDTGKGGQTIFDVTANVDFATKKLTINSSNSIVCLDINNIGTCTSNHNIGEFSNGSTPISYIGNNINGAVTATIGNASLSGTLDARFYGVSPYGSGAYELGGTFAMTGGDYYYYGAFGAERIYTSVENVATTHSETPSSSDFNKHTLTGFNANNLAGKTGNALPANAVQITEYDSDQKILTENIMGAVVEFDYDGDSEFSKLTLYFDDKKYITDGYPNTDSLYIKDDSPSGGAYSIFFRRDYIFGSTKNYMAGVAWSVSVDDYPEYYTASYAVTGFETVTIPGSDMIVFTGEGRGYYSTSQGLGETSSYVFFDVTANIDFSNRKVYLFASDTYHFPQLDFTGQLSYQAGTNNISGAIETIGDGYTNLTGTADAKFYGTGADSATEFGGTFSLYNEQSAYVGYFGASKFIDNIITTTITTPALNQHNLTGFYDGNRTSKTNNALKASTVQITKQKSGDEEITNDRITGAVFEFDYDADGDFVGIHHYLADKKYSRTSSNGGETRLEWGTVTTSNGDKLNNFAFNTEGRYMARVKWRLLEEEYTYRTYAYGFTGYETNSIPTTGAVRFAGEGQGQYYSTDDYPDEIYFDVIANVDFSNHNITLLVGELLFGNEIDQSHHLDFTANLSYQAGTNLIKGAGVTIGDEYGNNKLIGTVEAKFYGPNAVEFGGTFSLSNDDTAYIGYFGLSQKYTLSHQTLATTFPNVPTAPATSITGFDDTNRNNTSNHTLNSTVVQMISNPADKITTQSNITGAVIQFDYDSNANFNGVRFYFDNKKYSTTATGDNNKLNDSWTVDAGIHNSPDDFKFTQKAVPDDYNSFDFAPSYMAWLNWHSYEYGYVDDGYAVTGFETADIPTVTGITSFTGKGQGELNDDTYLLIAADVNFNSLQVKLSATHEGYLSELDFTGILSYVADKNLFAGDITTTGGIYFSKMFGTAEARLYGPNAEEFGGTFALQNDDFAYIGWFGAIRPAGTLTNQAPVADFEQDKTTSTPTTAPAVFNQNNLTSLSDDARIGTKGNKLLGMVTTLTKASDNTVTNGGITSAAAELSYADDAKFNGLTLYLPDRKYSTTDEIDTDNYIYDNTPSADDGHDTPNTFGLSKSASPFSFAADYMARIYWRLDKASHGYDGYGYAITGFETDSNNIPTTGGATFTGKGEGQYYSNNSSKKYFTVTATANFATRNINLATTHTDTNYSYLNLTGTLNYAEDTNAITGAVETVGTGTEASKLKGTAEARFYGPAAEELGGVFSVSNENAGYIGYFGARK